ncbi:MAG: family N-acetyltransferase [Caulobacter sp.]|jgi:ribosomal protein S18 acetylase RimI-like enzyme|nr:family N-acetyltransferase [Caulobacter sp.]
MSAPTIRRATLQDADALSRIGAQTFTETFGHLYPVEDLATFLVYAYGIERTRADLADPAKASWLVERDGKVIGYASAGPAGLPHDDLKPTDGELYRLYMLAAHQGGGVGRRLLDTVLAWLERDGPRTLWIGVWSLNHGAQRLYGRLGFEKVGDYIFPVGQTMDEEFILRRG